ncbi:phytanoyl-CoA dioxygenase family protein [Autumnicola edwardsiae]|uniref:Phytanoyl-CoA dioxygenase family protein n=1 Tax=Autumnicola edwardsiae TaxID=3075594 RepID=A0ABU3CW86_9FLAO|nr:phytanoyl-CoA dioxygenase family protein [Zunongwangia sp. F297]MDT0650631.1 phytanoyl-CoA dioxygenase family protein [Zunongwangia sp. F297]
MSYKKLTLKDKETFDRDGYLLIPSFLEKEEVDILYGIAKEDPIINKKSYDRGDKEGLRTKLTLWYSLDDSIYSTLARCDRMVSGVEILLNGEAAHFHSKLMQKEPKVGGAWEWHQDYGYWYRDGFLFPDMLSVLTALTSATKENGCLQVIKGSHKMGRVEHGFSGEQVGADMERVEEAKERLGLVYVEMNPGDTLFFHSNLLHRSNSNRSESSRWSLISAYNKISNKPFKGTNTSSYTPLERVPNDYILKKKGKGMSGEADFKQK